jgi:hypothetical protein
MRAQLLGCLLAFHGPSHGNLLIESAHIIAIRPDGHKHITHLSRNARAVVYTTAGNFAVAETGEAISKMMEDCRSR